MKEETAKRKKMVASHVQRMRQRTVTCFSDITLKNCSFLMAIKQKTCNSLPAFSKLNHFMMLHKLHFVCPGENELQTKTSSFND